MSLEWPSDGANGGEKNASRSHRSGIPSRCLLLPLTLSVILLDAAMRPLLVVVLLGVIYALLSTAGHSQELADSCSVATDCGICVHMPNCNWCWDGPVIGCRRVIDPVQCCSICERCDEKIKFKAISLGLLLALGIGSVAVLIVSVAYSFYKYYWMQRHYFEVLE